MGSPAHVTSADTGSPGAAAGLRACISGLYPGSAAPDPGRWIREVRGVPAWSGVSVAHTPHPGASGGRPALARPGGAWELR